MIQPRSAEISVYSLSYSLRHWDLVQLHGLRPSDASEVVAWLEGIVLAMAAFRLLDFEGIFPSEMWDLGLWFSKQ